MRYLLGISKIHSLPLLEIGILRFFWGNPSVIHSKTDGENLGNSSESKEDPFPFFFVFRWSGIFAKWPVVKVPWLVGMFLLRSYNPHEEELFLAGLNLGNWGCWISMLLRFSRSVEVIAICRSVEVIAIWKHLNTKKPPKRLFCLRCYPN